MATLATRLATRFVARFVATLASSYVTSFVTRFVTRFVETLATSFVTRFVATFARSLVTRFVAAFATRCVTNFVTRCVVLLSKPTTTTRVLPTSTAVLAYPAKGVKVALDIGGIMGLHKGTAGSLAERKSVDISGQFLGISASKQIIKAGISRVVVFFDFSFAFFFILLIYFRRSNDNMSDDEVSR